MKSGLLGQPDMQVTGNGSSESLLRWYLDRSGARLPEPWVLSVPLWVYRTAMLAWALWLATACVRWVKWGWESFGTGGPVAVEAEDAGGASPAAASAGTGRTAREVSGTAGW